MLSYLIRLHLFIFLEYCCKVTYYVVFHFLYKKNGVLSKVFNFLIFFSKYFCPTLSNAIKIVRQDTFQSFHPELTDRNAIIRLANWIFVSNSSLPYTAVSCGNFQAVSNCSTVPVLFNFLFLVCSIQYIHIQ